MTTNGNPTIGAIDLAELFAMPLEALIDADAEAAQTFVEFIHKYGFEERAEEEGPDQPYGKLKMVSFTYFRPVEGGQPQAFQVEVPLLLLIPLPTLAIRDAQLDFNVEIFGIVNRSGESGPSAEEGGPPASSPPRRLQRPRLTTRFARAPRTTLRTREGGTTYEEVVSTKVQMKVKVNVVESDLPEGIVQLLNLTAQAISNIERNFPYITIVAAQGKTTLTSPGDSTNLIMTLSEADGTPIPDQNISLTQDPPNILQMPGGPLTTGPNGQARAEISLIVLPPNTPVMKTVTATATVQTAQYGAVDAMGTIRIQVNPFAPIEPS